MTPIEKMLEDVEFIPTKNAAPQDDKIPYVTHEGVLTIGDIEIKVCQLNTGQRIIPEDELSKLLKA